MVLRLAKNEALVRGSRYGRPRCSGNGRKERPDCNSCLAMPSGGHHFRLLRFELDWSVIVSLLVTDAMAQGSNME